jgi:hypothetical protein
LLGLNHSARDTFSAGKVSDQEIKIDFAKFQGPVYTGRERGEKIRQVLRLDEIDARGDSVDVEIPESTYTVSSSFFLGLFGPSIVRAGSKEVFYGRYHFHSPSFLGRVVDGYVARALQRRNLFV